MGLACCGTINTASLLGECQQRAVHATSPTLSPAKAQACTFPPSPWTMAQTGGVSHDSRSQLLCSSSTGLNLLLLFLDMLERKVLGTPQPQLQALSWSWPSSQCTFPFAWEAGQEQSLQGCRRCTHCLVVSSKDWHMLLHSVNSYSNQKVGPHIQSQVHRCCW